MCKQTFHIWFQRKKNSNFLVSRRHSFRLRWSWLKFCINAQHFATWSSERAELLACEVTDLWLSFLAFLSAFISSWKENKGLIIQHFCSWSDFNGRLKTWLWAKPLTTDLCGQKHKQTSQNSASWWFVYWLARLFGSSIHFGAIAKFYFHSGGKKKQKNKKKKFLLSWASSCLKVQKWFFLIQRYNSADLEAKLKPRWKLQDQSLNSASENKGH